MRASDVAVGDADQVAHKVLDVAADVTRLREFCRIGFHEGDTDQFGHAANEVRFTDASRAHQQDVLLLVIGLLLAFHRHPYVVIVVAERDAEDLLGFILLNNKPIEMLFHLARFVFEVERGLLFGRRFVGWWFV